MLLKSWLALPVLVLSLSLPAVAAPPPVPRGPEFRVNANTRLSHYNPSISAFPDGGFVVVWSSSPGYRARFLDSQGRPTSGDILLLGVDGASQVVADRDGSFLVTWAEFPGSRTSSSIFVRRFNRDGTPRGKRIRVNELSDYDRYRPVITIGPDSRFAVAWRAETPASDPEAGGYTNAVARIFTAQGIPLTPELTLHAGDAASAAGDDAIDAFPSSLALKPDGTLAALVQDLESGCLHSYLAQVSPDGEPLPLQTLGSHRCGTADLRGQSASLAMGKDGSLVAVWSDYTVQAQRFAPDGAPRGQAFAVSQKQVAIQFEPAVALQAGGSFVVTWTEENRDGDGLGLFARSFAASGAARTRDFRLNTRTEGDQSDPAIAALRQGPAVVVWTNQPPAAGRSDIAARVLVPR